MSVLISQTKLFPIDLKYAEVKFKNGLDGIVVIESKEDEEKFAGKIKELKTQWYMPNWKEHTEIIRQSQIWDEFKGERTIDFRTYRALCLENFLKAWDVAGEDGKPIPCNKENIARLDNNIAWALQTQFVDRSIPAEQELKN